VGSVLPGRRSLSTHKFAYIGSLRPYTQQLEVSRSPSITSNIAEIIEPTREALHVSQILEGNVPLEMNVPDGPNLHFSFEQCITQSDRFWPLWPCLSKFWPIGSNWQSIYIRVCLIELIIKLSLKRAIS